ncbi:MAG: hypothetical protein ACREUZ_13970, partial [Burkholderiales bacterium]
MTLPELPLLWLPLADAVVKVTLILAIAAAASFALRRRSAALRHLVWTLALCSALALPVLTLALPKWQIPIFHLPDVQTTVAARVPPGSNGPLAKTEDDVAARVPPGSNGPLAKTEDDVAPGPTFERTPPERGRPAPARATSNAALTTAESPAMSTTTIVGRWSQAITWPQVLFAMWLLGASAILARTLIGLVAVQWLSRRTEQVTDA